MTAGEPPETAGCWLLAAGCWVSGKLAGCMGIIIGIGMGTCFCHSMAKRPSMASANDPMHAIPCASVPFAQSLQHLLSLQAPHTRAVKCEMTTVYRCRCIASVLAHLFKSCAEFGSAPFRMITKSSNHPLYQLKHLQPAWPLHMHLHRPALGSVSAS
jgi:hypothetical protein